MKTQREVRDEIVDQLAFLVPQLEIEAFDSQGQFRDLQFDLVVRIKVGAVEKTLLVQVKSPGEPRYLRQAVARFEEIDALGPESYPLIAAPYISARGMAICRQHNVGCVDLLGNVYLAFDNVYIERRVAEKPERERRRLKSLVAPVSSRIIRAMLEDADRAWTLTELAETADASLGQTYKVSEKLAAEAFARKSGRGGLTLTDATGLLDLWRETYDVNEANDVHSFHTSQRDPRRLMAEVERAARDLDQRYAFTLHAGASLVAPHVRHSDVHFYVANDPQSWVDALDLHAVEFGGNIHLLRPYDEGIFYRLRQPEGIAVVGNIQLYLDLYNYPARGREQAEFLRDREIGF